MNKPLDPVEAALARAEARKRKQMEEDFGLTSDPITGETFEPFGKVAKRVVDDLERRNG